MLKSSLKKLTNTKEVGSDRGKCLLMLILLALKRLFLSLIACFNRAKGLFSGEGTALIRHRMNGLFAPKKGHLRAKNALKTEQNVSN